MSVFKTACWLVVSLIIASLLLANIELRLSSLQWVALKQLLVIYVVFCLLCYVVSTLTGNYSQVDKLWSIMPVIYAWVIAHHGGYTPILMLMALLVTAWGVRLTYNFSRRGGYSWKFWTGDEDYRWSIVRQKPEFQNPIAWTLFNLLFICFYQMGLILLCTLPMLLAMGDSDIALTHWIVGLLILITLVIETAADQQQWNFQQTKQRSRQANDTYENFINTGLWSKVRHPNYSAEQMIWILFYILGASVSGQWFNWTIAGCILLVVLFVNSAKFSEGITLGKYPEYAGYQQSVPLFIPKLV